MLDFYKSYVSFQGTKWNLREKHQMNKLIFAFRTKSLLNFHKPHFTIDGN